MDWATIILSFSAGILVGTILARLDIWRGKAK